MTQIEKLGMQLSMAAQAEVPLGLIAFIATTSHAKRLQELFQGASGRLLAAHQDVQKYPNSVEARYQRSRSKALLDLIRVRMAMINVRKPSVDRMLALMDRQPPENVVDIRKAA